MNILLVEPYFTGSHADWVKGYQQHSQHQVDILSLEGQFWKWRMHGGAVTLARKYLQKDLNPDLILATDMLDLTTFLALTRHKTGHIPVVMYFHENQLCYPWAKKDRDRQQKRDKHYGFINFTSALSATACCFNSHFHLSSFLKELPKLLNHYPDYKELESVQTIADNSEVLHLGLDLHRFDNHKPDDIKNREPIILWNHRWEYDKNPQDFFNILFHFAEKKYAFKVVILGENFKQNPEIFKHAEKQLKEHILHIGYAKSFKEYAQWLWKADILPVTSFHDFFGAGIVEAVFCGCYPVLPKRLSYPEIIPYKKFPHYFYQNTEELYTKLEKILATNFSPSPDLKNSVLKYDWNNLSNRYDKYFENIFTLNKNPQ